MRKADRDRWLAALWAPRTARPGLLTLFALDVELWGLPARIRDPLAAELRLAWWRDQLIALDRAPPPAQPLLQAVAAALTPTPGGAALATLEDAPLARLRGEPEAPAQHGRTLFSLAARILGLEPVPGLGAAWGVGQDGRATTPLHAAPPSPGRNPSRLRPLLALDRLGRRDLARGDAKEAHGSLARQALIAWTMLTG